MAKLSSKILEHIKFAKAWLDKAERQFMADESTKGELTLTLAQAEVKYAWETSRAHVETAARPVSKGVSTGLFSRLSRVNVRRTVFVVLVLMTILTGSLSDRGTYEHIDSSLSDDSLSTAFVQKLELDIATSNKGMLRQDIDMGLRQMATVFAQGETLVPRTSLSEGIVVAGPPVAAPESVEHLDVASVAW